MNNEEELLLVQLLSIKCATARNSTAAKRKIAGLNPLI
jgi:hypothetical protein